MLSLSKFSPRSFDWVLFFSVLLLVILGLAAIYSVDLSRHAGLIYFKKQLVSLGLGLLIFFAAALAQPAFFRFSAKLWYWLSLLLLVGVLIWGENIRGTTGWFVFGGFSFQPVELAKVGVILILAYVIARFRRHERPLFFAGTGALVALVILLVLFQPDLGSAVVVGLVWLGLMLLVGARRRLFIFLIVLLLAGAALGWSFLLRDYQKDRFLSFIDPDRDPLGSGYNVAQSIIAVGSGRLWGKGLGYGSQSQLRFLPEAQTDFVFSVISEELGFAGAAAMLILFGVMFWRLLRAAANSADDFSAAAVSGAVMLFFIQFFVNLGANLGLVPVTGVTLPFVSYGGSSLVISFLLLGMAESMVGEKY